MKPNYNLTFIIYPRMVNGSIVKIDDYTYRYCLKSTGRCEFQLKYDFSNKQTLANCAGTIYLTQTEVANMLTDKKIIIINDNMAKFWPEKK